jgi:hypothetical protein
VGFVVNCILNKKTKGKENDFALKKGCEIKGRRNGGTVH